MLFMFWLMTTKSFITHLKLKTNTDIPILLSLKSKRTKPAILQVKLRTLKATLKNRQSKQINIPNKKAVILDYID